MLKLKRLNNYFNNMSTNQIEQTQMLLEQERLAPLKVMTQHAPKDLAATFAECPGFELLGDVDLQTARARAGEGADFEVVNYKTAAGSIKIAQENGVELLFLTNENQDQLGLCARKFMKGHFHFFTAHQIALLLSEILIAQHQPEYSGETDSDERRLLILRSLTLTDAFDVQAAYKQVKAFQVFPGLENLSQSIEEYQQDYKVLLAVDEANHVLFPASSPAESIEKGMKLLAEKALELKQEGKTLFDFLVELYKEYGFYQEKTFAINREDEAGEKYFRYLMDQFRKQSPETLFGKSIRVVSDFQKRSVYNHLTEKKGKTDLPKADVLQFLFSDNTKITVVPSDDYSRLSYHFSVTSRVSGKDAVEEARIQANDRIMGLMERIGKI
jgi:phosphoglucomutase